MLSKHVFLYAGTRLKKKPTDVTRVHSTAITSSHVRQPGAHDAAEIESTASSMTTIESDQGLNQKYMRNRDRIHN